MNKPFSVQHSFEKFTYGYENENGFSSHIATHMHMGWEFLFVKNGTLAYAVDGNVFDITPGSLIISRPGEIHALYPKGIIRYERHSLIISDSLAPADIIRQIPQDFYVLDASDNKIILDMFDKIEFYRTRLREDQLETILWVLISELWLNLYISIQDTSRSVTSHSNTVITNAVGFIKEHIREPLTVRQVSDALYITPSYLHQCFAKHLNITPRQYIMAQKLQLVQQALSAGANPTEICRQYGFGNYSTFYRNYQKVYGCRPSRSPKQPLLKIELS